MTTFVLVHGSFGGGWVWREVAPLLREAGAAVHVPRLTGVSDRSHLLGCGADLETHVTDVVELVRYEDLTEVVLVGHSYGGMMVTGAAARAPARLSRLVYLDAYVPEDGQSEVDLWPAGWRSGDEVEEAEAGGVRQPLTAATLGVDDPELAEWMEARMTPQPLATYTQPVPPGSDESAALPRAFVHCTGGPIAGVFAPFAAKAREAGWEVRELATGHMAMLTAPDEVADLLLELPAPDS